MQVEKLLLFFYWAGYLNAYYFASTSVMLLDIVSPIGG